MKKLIFFSILSQMIFPVYGAGKVLKISSGPWCPFNCDGSNPQKLGVVVDIAKAVFEKEGYQIDYQVMNYARALTETRSGVVDAVAGCAKEDAPDFIFPTKPIVKTSYKYLALKDSKLSINKIESLKGVRVGAINGYTYDGVSTEAINNKNPSFMITSGEEGLDQLFKMLKSKRVDAIIDSEEVLVNFISDKKLNLNDFKFVGMMKQTSQEISLCFSPKKKESKDLAMKLVKGMDALKKSGELKKIFDKYSMKQK